MPNASDILWFKQQFGGTIRAAIAGTPFDVDMLTAIACQETGYIWQVLRKKPLSTDKILELCVGDTLDQSAGRKAFPKTKAALVAKPNGQAMFQIARQALLDMAMHVPGYAGAAAKADKFCHGFGVFQYDLQFFLTDPNYFLERRYANFDASLDKCLAELKRGLAKLGWKTKTSLTDHEMACVGIAYNTGGFKPAKGLKQGHYNKSSKKFYGELLFEFIRLSRTVALPGQAPEIAPPAAGHAIVAQPSEVTASGAAYVVDTSSGTLRLRSEPKVSKPATANVVGEMPDGHPVRAVTGKAINGFLEVETSLSGALLRGFASKAFLKTASAGTSIPVVVPAAAPPSSGIVAVYMPRKPGTVTKRTAIAGAHTLNESGQPGRTGTTPDALRADLAAIIDWLAVDKTAHKRYQPRDGLTFCNIYAHDFCHLAGAYLPRVWWTPKALLQLSNGGQVKPLYGDTIDEQRANDLFRWLRDFGPAFGWRQTGTLDKLQLEANQGALGLIVARRKNDGKSGHIVMVVPETDTAHAKRDAAGAVTAPLQSQAGATNFRYSTGKLDWWKGDQFAESAFWLHA